MGILRDNKSVKRFIQDADPFDGLDQTFLDSSVFSPSSGKKHQNHRHPDKTQLSPERGMTRRSLRTWIVIGLFMMLTGFVVARSKIMGYFGAPEIVYAYFEVRALDANGRPIAGAVVKNGGKRVGTTDSFGEWRRYMRVPLGATVPVTIAKKSGGNSLLYATKNFAVPPAKPEKSEIELRGSVQLQATDVNNAQANTAALTVPNDMMRVAAKKETKLDQSATGSSDSGGIQGKSISSDTLTAVEPEMVDKSTTAGESGSEIAHTASASGMVIANDFKSSHESVWFEQAGASSATIQRDVLPALIQRAKELGLRVDKDATWRVRLTHLMDKPAKVEKEGGGLLLVSSSNQSGGGSEREFLRNYHNDSGVTAKGILYVLAHHVNKNIAAHKVGDRWVASLPKSSSDLWKLSPGMIVMTAGQLFTLSDDVFATGEAQGLYLRPSPVAPCPKSTLNCELRTRSFSEAPPMPQWKRLRLKAMTYGKESIKIFVSGYEAKLVGDKVYEFWGQDHVRANVTVVSGGRVVARTQVIGDAKNPPVIGAATITRR